MCRGVKKGKTWGGGSLFIIPVGLGTCKAKEDGSFKRSRGARDKPKSLAVMLAAHVKGILVAPGVLSG